VSFRTEEKLKVDPSRLPRFLAWLDESGATIRYPSRQVISIYLDNDRFGMYYDSTEGVLPRKKIRYRRYEPDQPDVSPCTLETKISSVEGRYKTSVVTSTLSDPSNHYRIDNQYGICRPRVTVSYLRSYFVLDGFRLTLDRELQYQGISMNGPTFTVIDPCVVIEVKGPHNIPIDLLNTTFPWERVRFSKYCQAVDLTLLNPLT